MKLTFPLATCIVMSGIYEDDLDKADEIIYTGQGGNDLLGNHRQIGSQQLSRGNLALKVGLMVLICYFAYLHVMYYVLPFCGYASVLSYDSLWLCPKLNSLNL